MNKQVKHKLEGAGTIKLETLESLSRRYGIVLKDRDRMLKAAQKIDSLREKYGSEKRKFTAVEIIRKGRESR